MEPVTRCRAERGPRRTELESDTRGLERRALLAFTLPDLAFPVLLLVLLAMAFPHVLQDVPAYEGNGSGGNRFPRRGN